MSAETFFVPVDASLETVREAFESDSPEVREEVSRIKYAELADVVRSLLDWFLSHPQPKLAGDLLASTFGAALRHGLKDAELAQRNGLNREQFEREKAGLLKALELRRVTSAELQTAH